MAELVTIPSEGAVAAGDAVPRAGSRAFARFRRHRLALFGVVTILVLVLGSAVGPYLIPFDELFIDIRHRFAPPFISAHVLGTDPLGRDLRSRIFVGGALPLLCAALMLVVAFRIGLPRSLTAADRARGRRRSSASSPSSASPCRG